MEHLHRYAPIVDDLEAFLAAAEEPLHRVVWANTVRTTAEEVEGWIHDRCPEAERVSWFDAAWRIPAGAARPGKWPEFVLGLIHTQEEVSLWPVWALDARPGEAVLDMCAAPGSKAARTAVAMADRGRLMANDRKWGRLQGVQDVVARLGLTCVASSNMGGAQIPGDACFDRVLVDAPCTGEGTTRKAGGGKRPQIVKDDFHKLASVQKGLLRRAVELVRPGGTVIYATCTYAPEENEAVLDGIYPEKAEIEPIRVPEGVRVAPGVTEWQGRSFRPDVANAIRFWPHLNDTGGFFVARLRRL
ncbi:RsmB/NOP family class I SAM-dependent RNA methyltransferase [Thiohalorhabdus sp. Cl-TMA]|uniref:RsmB/NOP family class I SAM-dependent RNA methyltransferase n=1 Tax=Thiohalorhabdus methylotrophus TaxID=3242694 RepID=A0ABV4TU75_9GAMM